MVARGGDRDAQQRGVYRPGGPVGPFGVELARALQPAVILLGVQVWRGGKGRWVWQRIGVARHIALARMWAMNASMVEQDCNYKSLIRIGLVEVVLLSRHPLTIGNGVTEFYSRIFKTGEEAAVNDAR